ncbi:hypothetical protein [Nonomuraea sp. SBT364]|uniref:hypothetical protein n=1 Tax=Nonomuraea sp. SBT364 TaxID=1580530 RepID=UPI00066AF4A4|nr:hypothetical protein [Nonomuraea sp. SBT364]
MADVASPLQFGDPPRLGPFVVQARLHAAPAGFVYLGQGPDGRAVSLAVLTRGAAFDAAARERFVTALREAAPAGQPASQAGVRGWLGRAGRSRSAVVEDAPAVLGMNTGRAPWVAVPYVPGKPGAERFLEPVMVGGTLIGQAHGPDFVPYWLTDRAPALAPPVRRRPLTETRRRVLMAALAVLVLLLLMTVIALLMLVRTDNSDPMPRQLPPTQFLPSPPPTPATPEPQQPSPSPTPSPSRSGEETPGRSPGGDSSQDPQL